MGATSKGRCVRFGMFEADLAARELYKRGRRVPLQEQPFRILVILLGRPGQIVSREELQSELWPNGTHVEFSEGLDTALKKLRHALGDSAQNPTFIETIPRRGYRLIASVRTGDELLSNVPIAPPNGTSVETNSPLTSSVSRRFGWLRIGLIGLGAVVLACLVIWRVRISMRSSSIHSLVVLPLENLSGDPSQEYFADGMTDQLITNLGQIETLRVISRTSAMQYRGVHKPLPQIARELQVDALIEGTVLRLDDKVRITAQLIDAREDRHLWAQSFEGELKDVLALQDDVSRAIASQVRKTLLPGENVKAQSKRPLNMEAYESYLKGEYYLNRFSAESIQQALVYFQQALEKDPEYAPAYTKISGCYQMLANMNVLPKTEGNEKAKTFVMKALELDPNFGPAHAGLGWGMLLYDLNVAAAGDEFKRAVSLNPNSVEGHEGLGNYYAAVGQVQEAVREMERARELDPLASIVNHDLCQTLVFARRYDQAQAQCKANLDLDSKAPRSLWVLVDVYAAQGMDSEALTYIQQALRASGAPSSMLTAAQAGASRGGLKGCWQALIPFALEGVRKGGMDAFHVAAVYAQAGDSDKAILWLSKAVEARSFGITFIGVDPIFDSLRSDPRFVSLLKLIGLPQSQIRE